MSIKERVAYLQGLAEGMDIDAMESGKLLSAIIDTICDMADEIDELNENALDIGEELDAISEDLADVEMILEDLDLDDDDDYDFDFDEDYFDEDYEDEDDDDDDFGCNFCGGNVEFSIDVNCPECGAEIELDEEDIANESVTCPACGKLIELEIDEVDVDMEDDADEAAENID